jgi:uncharacterized membrane protein YkoI
MKTLTALFTAAALTLTAGFAQADDDVPGGEIPALVANKTIMPLDQLEKIAKDLHKEARITDTDLEKRLNGAYEYKVELELGRDEWDVVLDASNGKVLSDRRD